MGHTFEINNNPKKRTLIQKGFKAFNNEDYKNALKFFSEAIFLDQDDLETKIGLLLSDMANDFPTEAYGFYEFYQSMLSTQPRSAREKIQKQILELIASFDTNLNKISYALKNEDSVKAESIDGILFADFKKMCDKHDFKEVFQNLMFSTKIIFTHKDDFYNFLDLLVENDFYEMSISYIENMRNMIFYDKKINEILRKAAKKQSENTKTN
ncbi:histidine kinase [Helicobacter sp. 13S00477-4]|uniref:histidine kinase n=1 Tax=Helicobacter sp. 13S00477-4 TaxID=1905759 RepID=UPI000BA769FA|nr:histidine kinase [Helicobacter sp. 13S00477-4]PAF51652.1 histidine kinase [Helicobacter sp. 13S00477-4]